MYIKNNLTWNYFIQLPNRVVIWKFNMLFKVEAITYGIVSSMYRANGNKCKHTLVKEKVDSFIPLVQILQKNSPYTKAINQQLRWIDLYFIILTGLFKSHFIILSWKYK